jgi:hypothetical protein
VEALKKNIACSAIAGIIALCASASVSAAVVTFEYDINFGTGSVVGPSPWMTVTFDDGGSAGSVDLTIQLEASLGTGDINQLYFNLNPVLDATQLNFARTGGTGPTASNIDILLGTDAFQADGDGIYDIYMEFPPPPGQQAARFNAGEFLTFQITGIASLTADDFNFLAEVGGSNGPFYSAAQAIDVVNGESTWIAAVPVPAAVWLFGSALGALGWTARRRRQD